MFKPQSLLRFFLALFIAASLLSGCGGGGGESRPAPQAAAFTIQEANAPVLTGDTATDGLNWFNFRRQQLGLSVLTRNSQLDTSAQNHSMYQALNDTITHTETAGKPGYTGTDLGDRLDAAGYRFHQSSYAYGEVISSTSNASGVYAAEGLITAIYHRFVIFEPMFKEQGGGAAVSGSGKTYFTTNFGADGLSTGLGHGNIVTYPFNGQQRVIRNFFSDTEIPDPVASKNEVGFPISVHADITANLTVQSFTVRPQGGAVLNVQQLLHAPDTGGTTRYTAAAIVPLDPLAAGTTYQVQFNGTVDGVAVSRSWSFTTQ
jgi:uncharacterized protein YkwD